MSRFGKLSAQLDRRLLVSFGGFFRRVEVSQSMALARALNFRGPAFSHSRNAFEATGVVNLYAAIVQVLGRCCFAQVLPAIIAVIFIPMIYFKRRPFTRHPQPDDTVCKIVTTLDDDADVPLHSWGTRLRAFGDAIRWRVFVEKLSRPFVVIEKVPDVFGCEIGVGVLVPSGHSARSSQDETGDMPPSAFAGSAVFDRVPSNVAKVSDLASYGAQQHQNPFVNGVNEHDKPAFGLFQQRFSHPSCRTLFLFLMDDTAEWRIDVIAFAPLASQAVKTFWQRVRTWIKRKVEFGVQGGVQVGRRQPVMLGVIAVADMEFVSAWVQVFHAGTLAQMPLFVN